MIVLFDAKGEAIADIEAVGQLIAGGTLERTRPEWETSDSNDELTRTWIVPAIALEHESVSAFEWRTSQGDPLSESRAVRLESNL